MQNIGKRLGAALLAVVLCLGLLAVPAGAESSTASGDFGTGNALHWEFDGDTGTLTISGAGEMPDYNGEDQPWLAHKSNITTVNIGEGITSVGSNAFWLYGNLTTVKLPAGLTNIGNSAFSGCTSLTDVKLPASLTTIEIGAFNGCKNLPGVEIPAGVTTIEGGVFEGCSRLNGVDLPSGLTSIGRRAFAECSSLTAIEIPGSVTDMDDDIFQSCTALKTVKFHPGVTVIAGNMFSYCTGLDTVEIPATVTAIYEGAFAGCTSLTDVELPAGLTAIGGSAFAGCNRLTHMDIPAGVTTIEGGVFQNCSGLTHMEIPAKVTTIEMDAFSLCTSLAGVTIPASVTTIGARAFDECTALNTVTYLGTPAQWGEISIDTSGMFGNANAPLMNSPRTYRLIDAGRTSLDFGSVPAGETPAETVTVTTYGGTGAEVKATVPEDSGFTVTPAAPAERSGETATFTIQPKGDLTVGVHTTTVTFALDPAVEGENVVNAVEVEVSVTVTENSGVTPPPAPPPVQPTPPAPPVADDDDEEPTYAPSYEIIGKGKAVTNPRTPAAGQNVTLTLTPGEGWEVSTLRLSTRAGEVDATRNSDGTYSYTQPEGRVTIRVVFREVWKNPFSDVPEDAWYMDALRLVLDQGLMSGMADGTFNPDGTASRQQVWMILARLSGYQPADMAAAKAWATANGISDGTNPGGAVTRQQLWMLLARVAGERPADMASAKAWAMANGISDGSNPGGAITRAQLAVTLARFVQQFSR